MSKALTKASPKELLSKTDLTAELVFEIIDDKISKRYLSRLNEMKIIPVQNLLDLEIDLINNVRLYRITEMVYGKGESITDKFTTVFNALSTYNVSTFVIIDSDGEKANFYLGVRNNDPEQTAQKRSTVTLGDTLKQTLIGHFPGARIENEDRKAIARLSSKIEQLGNVASVSVVGNNKSKKDVSNEEFVQGLEKLALAMNGRSYTGIIIADSQNHNDIQKMRHELQDTYTSISAYQKVQFSKSDSQGTQHAESFADMTGARKAATIGKAATMIAGPLAGAAVGAAAGYGTGTPMGVMVGSQLVGQMCSLIDVIIPSNQLNETSSESISATRENKAITDMMSLLNELIQKTDEYSSYGLWNVAGYFISDDMSAAEIAANNYRSLMNGENSGREISAINSWRRERDNTSSDYDELVKYLSRFRHPQFEYGSASNPIDATTAISGKELGLHLGLPRATVPGLPVIEHAEFGKEVITYQLFQANENVKPEDRITLGKIFDLGHITETKVELNNRSLNMHTFITGSTGSGKSNAVYQMLNELHQDKIPFLVIEPAKGEYKDVFGHLQDVRVFSTNPNVAPLINLNPFMFPKSIHVLEHIDGLVEIFGSVPNVGVEAFWTIA